MELFAFSEVQTRLSIEHVRSEDVCCRTLKKIAKEDLEHKALQGSRPS